MTIPIRTNLLRFDRPVERARRWTVHEALSKDAALLTGTAFVGAYTTFSTWMLESQRLGEERRALAEIANIVVSVVLGLAAALLGQWLAEQL